MASIDHTYGATTSNPTPLLAIPLPGGSVNITLKKGTEVVGTTVARNNGKWKDSFVVASGEYTVEFTGQFRPIGKDATAMYNTLIRTISMTITVKEET